MSKFLKVKDVQLLNGGYLSDGEGSPVTNVDFIIVQRRAEYIVTFAALAKDKDFVGKKADSLDDLRAEVASELATKATVFVKSPKKASKKLATALHDEAMAFMNWEGESTNVEKMNAFLQEFEILRDFESHGLFFDDGIVKLNKIYSLDAVVAAVKSTINLLD